MLSVLFAETGDCLAHLLRFYAPNAPALLDITYGAGALSRRVSIPVVGVDKDPLSKASIVCDLCSLPFEDAAFHVACFDPPYLYGYRALHMGLIEKTSWETQRSTWKHPDEFRDLSSKAAQELYRVIVADGVVIVKVMPSRFKGRMIRNEALAISAFEDKKWRLHDQIVYIRTLTGSFVNNVSAQNAHGFYLVFKKDNQDAATR